MEELAAFLFGSAIVLDGREIAHIAGEAADYRARGGYVSILRAHRTADDGATPVEGADCALLADSPGVVAAGPVSNLGRAWRDATPGAPFNVIETTTGGLAALSMHTDSTVVAVHPGPEILAASSLAAEEQGLSPGRTVATSAGQEGVIVAVVAARTPTAARSIISLRDAEGPADTCWVEAEPAAFTAVSGAASAGLATVDAVVSTQRLLDGDADFGVFDPSRDLATRQTRLLPILVGAAGGIVIASTLWMRRSSIGMYRAMSLGWPTVAWIRAGEMFTAVWIALLTGGVWAAVALELSADTTWPVLAFTARSATVALAACGTVSLLAVLTLTRGNVMDQLKDR